MREVEHQRGIEGHATDAGLEVQMATSGTACVSAESYRVTGMHYLVLANQLLGQMSVDRLQSVGMTYYQIMAVAAALVT